MTEQLTLSLFIFMEEYKEILRCHSLVTKLCPTLVTPWTIARQATLSMGFPREGYWSGLLFPSPGYLPDSGIKPTSPALAVFFTAEPPGQRNH